jgi:hypothetical protein
LLRDRQLLTEYPLHVWQKFERRKTTSRCAVCDLYPAQWIVFGDKYADCSPLMSCGQCYYSMHYEPQTGQLLYSDFSVFPIDAYEPPDLD